MPSAPGVQAMPPCRQPAFRLRPSLRSRQARAASSLVCASQRAASSSMRPVAEAAGTGPRRSGLMPSGRSGRVPSAAARGPSGMRTCGTGRCAGRNCPGSTADRRFSSGDSRRGGGRVGLAAASSAAGGAADAAGMSRAASMSCTSLGQACLSIVVAMVDLRFRRFWTPPSPSRCRTMAPSPAGSHAFDASRLLRRRRARPGAAHRRDTTRR